MNNNIVKIQIPISEFYQIINSANTLKAQQLTILGMVVKDRPSYDTMAESLKKVNDAIKDVEIARKNVTAPVDAFKKELIKLETDTLAELKQFVEDGKRKMIEYSQELERKKAEAEAKLKAEAEASLNNPMMAMAEALGTFTDKLFATSVSTEHTKNIRTITKARISGEVDWMKVLSVQFANKNINPEDLLKGLPKAMRELGVDAIEGIEIYEEKTQIIR
jgi:roadblock/LC7 domain-containing protein